MRTLSLPAAFVVRFASLTRFASVACFAFLVLVAPASARQSAVISDDAASFEPNILPELTIPRVDSPVKLDGLMDEPSWAAAGVATNFSETYPGEMTRPPIDIEVRTLYDEKNLYLFYTITDDPSAIRAHMSDRDAIWQDDYVGLILDPNKDGATRYFIAANPFGIQGDTRMSRDDEDVTFDLIYDTAARITDTGYQVEFAIPFRSLRFPAGDVQSWAATFWITHPRSSRNTYSWAAMDRDNPCGSCQFGTLNGISGVVAGKNLEILPSFTTTQFGSLADAGDPQSAFDNARVQVEPSLNVKYGITSDLTADLTVNPDFSQIEADAAQIDVNTRFALFFPEQRPFFQEGADLFDTWLQTVYTRSINDPIVATKFTGRFGRTSVGYIGGRDNTTALLLPFEEGSSVVPDAGRSISNIVRVQHNLPGDSFVGALATDRRLDEGGSGSTFAVDGLVRFATNYQFEGQVAGSRTVEANSSELSAGLGDDTFDGGNHTIALDGESYNGWATYLSLERDSRYWDFNLDYYGTSPTFRADNGFVTQNNSHRLIAWTGATIYPQNSFVDRIYPGIEAARVYNFDGVRKDEWLGVMLNAQMKRQTHVSINAFVSNELYRGIEFEGIRSLEFNISSNFSDAVGAEFWIGGGRTIARNLETPELGRRLDGGMFLRIRPTQRLVLSPTINFSRLRDLETGDNFFSGYIFRMRTNYQFTRRFFARAIVQYNDFTKRLEVDPLFTYKVNAYTAVYLGSTHDLDTYPRSNDPTAEFFRQSNRQLFFKLQYLFRR